MREPLFPAQKFYNTYRHSQHKPDTFLRSEYELGIIAATRNSRYICGPLNHFGATRLPNSNGSVFQQNAGTMESVARLLAQEEDNDSFVLPHHIGRREGWGEFYYNFHWLAFLSGTPYEQANYLLRKCEEGAVDYALINDKTADPERRRVEYHKMLHEFTPVWDWARRANKLNPISGIVVLPDVHMSLGGRMEVDAADHLGIPTYYPEFSLPAIADTIYSRARETGVEFDPPVRVNPNQEQMIRLVSRQGTVYQAN